MQLIYACFRRECFSRKIESPQTDHNEVGIVMKKNSARMRRTWIGAVAAIGATSLLLAGCSAAGTEAGDEPEGDTNADACDLAEGYPNGPIELIVPWAAGGGTDATARLVGTQLSEALDTQVNVVNRAGGSGVVGHSAMANANPDGQTLGLVTVEIGMMHWQGLTDLSYKDLTAVSQLNEDPAGITVNADAPWNDAQGLLDHIEANPGEIRSSGTGQGGIWHIALLGLLDAAGLPLDSVNFIPSEGAAPALQELVAGGIDMTTNSLGESLTLLETGKVKALGAMGTERDPNFPDVPSVSEQTGIDYAMSVWRGISGPAGMEDDVVAELDCYLKNITESSEFGEFMDSVGLGIRYRNSADFAELMKSDDELKGKIMEKAGLAK